MQGYLFRLSYNSESLSINNNLLPSDLLSEFAHIKIFPGADLFTWGKTQGDVHVSYKAGKSILILNGYITDAPGINIDKSQQMLCDSLRNFFDCNRNTNRITDFISKLNGSFSIIYFNFNDFNLHSISDRFSSRQLWWKHSRNDIIFSSSAILLAKLSSSYEYSPASIGSYFLYGTLVEPSKSLFSNIFCQKEGTHKVLNNNNTTSNIVWYNFKHTPDNSRTVKDWIKLSSDCVIRAAERILRTTSNPMVFLSGGVDSRITTSALIAAGSNPLLCTIADSNNLEVRIAKLVAKNFKCDHHIIYRDEEWYLKSIQNKVFSSNGIYDWTHSHFSQAYAKLSKLYNIDAAILGDFFEAFSKLFCSVPHNSINNWSKQFFLHNFDSLPLPKYRPLNRDRTLDLFTSDYREVLEKQLQQDIIDRYNRICLVSEDPLIVSDYFFRWQTVTCLATFQMFNDIRSVGAERNIMFDKELHSLLEIMPSYIRNKSNLGSKIINYLSLNAAILPNSNSLLPLVSPEPFHKMAKSIKPLLGKLRRKLFTNTHHTTGSWSHLPLLYCNNKSWRNLIERRLLDQKSFPSHMFDPLKIEVCWKQFCSGNISLYADIERLLAFSIVNHF